MNTDMNFENEEINFHYRDCPACGSKDYSDFHTVQIDHYLRDLLKNISYADVVKCKNCGMIYTNPILAPDVLELIYKSSYQKRKNPIVRDPRQLLRNDHFITASKIKALNGENRVLDIGCNYGEFVYFLNSLDFNADGIDIMEERVEYGRKTWGINSISSKDIHDIDLKEYDVINLSQVVKHLANPYLMLEFVFKNMKEGAYLFVSVPNFGSFLHYLNRKNNISVPYQHCNNFTYFHLVKLFNRLQLKIVPQHYEASIAGFRYTDIVREELNYWLTKSLEFAPFNLMIIGQKK